MYAALLEDPTLEPPFVTLVVSGGHTLADRDGRPRPLPSARPDRRRRGGRGLRQGRAVPRPRLSRWACDRPPRGERRPGADRVPAPDARRRQRLLVLGAQDRGRAVRAQAPRRSTSPTSPPRSRPPSSTCSSTKLLRVAEQTGISTVVIGGGVAANSALRARLVDEGRMGGLRVVLPEHRAVHRQRGDGGRGAPGGASAADGPTPLDAGAYPGLLIG